MRRRPQRPPPTRVESILFLIAFVAVCVLAVVVVTRSFISGGQ